MDESIFRNRSEAGEKLAERLSEFRYKNPVVIALPRGGLPVAAPVAQRLGAPLEILVVRKIGVPKNPEFAIGAATEERFFWINRAAFGVLGMKEDEVRALARRESVEVSQKAVLYRKAAPLREVRGRSVIVVDDGFATGATALVAAMFLKKKGAREIILAAPVGAKETLARLSKQVERIVCLETPKGFSSVGEWYEDFGSVTDQDVISVLRKRALPTERTLVLPENPRGIVIFAHGSGSSRFSPRNQKVADLLRRAGFGTLLFDLLSEEEAADRARVFDIPFLAERLLAVTESVRSEGLPLGYFGASTGAAAALWAASESGSEIQAIVSRGGRPDLAMSCLERVSAPTLLIVGERDPEVLEMNQKALELIKTGELVVIPGATHLFEEPGALDLVTQQTVRWFSRYLEVERKVAS